MKKILFMCAFVAFSATASFAKDAVKVPNHQKNVTNKSLKDEVSCTVSVAVGGGSPVVVTVRCECTQERACDMAYISAKRILEIIDSLQE